MESIIKENKNIICAYLKRLEDKIGHKSLGGMY